MVNPFLYIFTGIYDYQLRWGEPHSRARNIAAMTTCLPLSFLVVSMYLALAKVLKLNFLEITKNIGMHLNIPWEAVWVAFVIPPSFLVVYVVCLKGKQYLDYYESDFKSSYFQVKGLLITLGCLFFGFFCMYLFG
ncbi:hypothetical protein [Colwellia sp. MEBiC06753]